MQELKELIFARWPELTGAALERTLEFYRLLLSENENQNLTRLTSPLDFYEGHLEDVRHLLKAGVLRYPAMDLGSGGGVPGLLAAVVEPKAWVLCDSEASKARFLSDAVISLRLSDIEVVSERAEAFLKRNTVASIVARAVGPVERIFAWIENCSTWNTLILLKGPGWDEEWAKFQMGRFKNALKIKNIYEYSTGELNKQRKIVTLERVPRGTVVVRR